MQMLIAVVLGALGLGLLIAGAKGDAPNVLGVLEGGNLDQIIPGAGAIRRSTAGLSPAKRRQLDNNGGLHNDNPESNPAPGGGQYGGRKTHNGEVPAGNAAVQTPTLKGSASGITGVI